MAGVFYVGNKQMEYRDTRYHPPGSSEVAIDVAFCGICGTDVHIFNGKMDDRVVIPQVIGHEMSGTVQGVGENVSQWKKGDRVVVRPLAPCNNCPACSRGHEHICLNLSFLGIDTPGALQSNWVVPENTLHKVPDELDLKTAALAEPLSVACHDVRLGEVQPGEKAVVIGGGPIGMLIAMVCNEVGAKVLVVEINPARVRLAKQLGFDAINPNNENAEKWVNNWTKGAGADVVFEVSGSSEGAMMMTDLVRTRGRIIVVSIFTFTPKVDLFKVLWREMKMQGTRVYEPQDFERALRLLSIKPKLFRSIISKTVSLQKSPKLFQEIDEGPEYMKILVDIQGGS